MHTAHRPSRFHAHRTAGVLTALAIAVAACSGGDDGAAPTAAPASAATTSVSTASSTTSTTSPTTPPTMPPSTTTTTPPVTDAAAPTGLRPVAPFADYRYVAPLDDSVPYAGPATPRSLDDVLLVPSQEWLRDPALYGQPELVTALVDRIEADGFVVQANTYRFFHDGYKASAYNYVPLFVTTDALYNAWHLVFDKILRDTEQARLLPILERLLSGAVEAARAQEAELAGTALADAAHRATAYYESAATLTGLDIGPVNDLAREELAKVEQAAGPDDSPITGIAGCNLDFLIGCVNYGLFVPRGHYTRTPELTRYFLGMSLLGQEGFPLADGVGVVPALLMSRVLVQAPALLADWTAIYEPTAFLVGLADDIDPRQAAAAADAVVPGWRDDLQLLAAADPEAIADALIAAHPVTIDPESAGIRLMGARFTLDSFVIDQLAFPNVGEDAPDQRRKNVSALDLAAVFGSPLARQLQLATEARFLHYTEQLDAMTQLVADRIPAEWAGTVYDAWLLAIAPQFDPNGAAYPEFMRGETWGAKALQTGLASYTELKHDTVLYTKQGSAGEGEGPAPGDFEKRNWVEPDPVAFGRIAAAAELLQTGFADRDLLTPDTDDLLTTLIELTNFLGGIATRELAGQVATDAESERLDGIGSELEYLWVASSDIEANEFGQIVPDDQQMTGLVTDVFTTNEQFLQLGTGRIDTIYVMVPTTDGRFELAEGQVFSYYEFWRNSSESRLTDEEWRALFRFDSDRQPPPRPAWVSSFLVGAEIATEPITGW